MSKKRHINAKVTEYKEIVFRSKLEAKCYDYLMAMFFDRPVLEVEEFGRGIIYYEPSEYNTSEWNPDFLVVTEYGEKILVEVKPRNSMFEIFKYVRQGFQKANTILCMSEEGLLFIHENGSYMHLPIVDMVWKQAYNNVQFYGKTI